MIFYLKLLTPFPGYLIFILFIFKNDFIMSEKSNNVWKTILKVIIAVATAIGGVLGIQGCIGL